MDFFEGRGYIVLVRGPLKTIKFHDMSCYVSLSFKKQNKTALHRVSAMKKITRRSKRNQEIRSISKCNSLFLKLYTRTNVRLIPSLGSVTFYERIHYIPWQLSRFNCVCVCVGVFFKNILIEFIHAHVHAISCNTNKAQMGRSIWILI